MRVPHAEAGSEARIVETAARGRLVVWDTPGPRRRADSRPAARRHPGRGHQLVGRGPDAGAALPRAGHGPARPRRGPARPGALPVGGLRGRRRRGRPGAGHRPGDRRRLLDGRHDRAGVLAPAPRADRRARAVRDRPQRLGLLPGAADRDDDAVRRRCPRLDPAGLPAERGPRRLAPARRHPGPPRAPGRAGPDAAHPAGHRARGHAGRLRLQLAPLDRRRRRARPRCWSPGTTRSCRRAARCAWPARCPGPRSSRSTATTTSSSTRRAPSRTPSRLPASPPSPPQSRPDGSEQAS